MTPIEELRVGDPIVRPGDLQEFGRYYPWVVVKVTHEPASHPSHASCRVMVRDISGDLASVSGFVLWREGWFRASLTADAAENLGANSGDYYEARALGRA